MEELCFIYHSAFVVEEEESNEDYEKEVQRKRTLSCLYVHYFTAYESRTSLGAISST